LDSPKLSGSIKQAYDKINYNPGRDGLITININAAIGVTVANKPQNSYLMRCSEITNTKG